MILTQVVEDLKIGSTIGFCPDLDRGAHFSIENIDPLPNNKVKVSIKWLPGGGRWSPDDSSKVYEFEVPEDFTTEDIECAWFGVPNVKRFTM